jgi:transposase
MASIALARADVIVGVDTHKDQHVAVALDGLGGDLDDPSIDASNDGYAELVAWALGLGRVVAFRVEGCGSYGIGLARFLRRHGHKVIEVSRPPRKGERRLAGKSDLIDARHAAREVLAGNATATPKSASGTIESIRLVKIVRDTAVKAHTAAMITLKATLVTAADELRGELEPLSDFKLITAAQTPSATTPARVDARGTNAQAAFPQLNPQIWASVSPRAAEPGPRSQWLSESSGVS